MPGSCSQGAVIQVTPALSLGDDEIHYETSRSGGPGGQNVNKVSTRVTAVFDLARSPTLTEEQRWMLATRLRSRLTQADVLRVTSQTHRTQPANREAARERLLELLRRALAQAAPRIATKATRASKIRRVQGKRRRGQTKRARTTVLDDLE